MSKSILVVDTPEMCIGCMFNDMQFCQAMHEGGEFIKDEDLERKPDWCPLHEIPKKKECNKYHNTYESGFVLGYNAAIDDILKGKRYDN